MTIHGDLSGLPGMDDDAMQASLDLVGRCGAREFEVGYLHDDVPWEKASWYAHAKFKGVRVTADEHRGPVEAVEALARKLLTGAQCKRCGGLIALSDNGAFAYTSAVEVHSGATFTAEDAAKLPQCRWRRMGPRWEMGCQQTPKTKPKRKGRPTGKGKNRKRAKRR